MSDEDDVVEHHGVKGMKWGVRKKTRSTSSDYKNTAGLRSRHPSELSNKQLQRANSRVNLEQNYKKLNPTQVEKGRRAVTDALAVAGTISAVYALGKSPLGKDLISAGKKVIEKRFAA